MIGGSIVGAEPEDIVRTSAPQPVLLDISRTLSRLDGKISTGVDRVELAYIRHFLKAEHPLFLLGRWCNRTYYPTTSTMEYLAAQLVQPDHSGHCSSDWRSKVIAELGPSSSWRLKSARLPSGPFSYINVSHTHLSPLFVRQLRRRGASQIIAMIHDTIPLDFPQFQTPQSTRKFAKLLRAVGSNCDTVIANSNYTKDRVEYWLFKYEASCDVTVAHLGIEQPEYKEDPQQRHPYFIQLGTIEPRKNHALLLRIWRDLFDRFGDRSPHLHIIGQRGWMNEELFKTLDSATFMGRTVFEHNRMSDSEKFRYLSSAKALLFPSFAEGFGIPLLEAASVHTRAICSDLLIFKELVGNAALYIPPNDIHKWTKAITKLAGIEETCSSSVPDINRIHIPTWDDHFRIVEGVLNT